MKEGGEFLERGVEVFNRPKTFKDGHFFLFSRYLKVIVHSLV